MASTPAISTPTNLRAAAIALYVRDKNQFMARLTSRRGKPSRATPPWPCSPACLTVLQQAQPVLLSEGLALRGLDVDLGSNGHSPSGRGIALPP